MRRFLGCLDQTSLIYCKPIHYSSILYASLVLPYRTDTTTLTRLVPQDQTSQRNDTLVRQLNRDSHW
ncbi:hypothetical protein AG1IA_05044 [Rhizoctonia solani AG-1 IA]|uniref:Uncharacterized protein n=1 Tax=Thanatephorus cucumeris (strain AG1-IA) TaxID=983506 RepID=L8WVT8_THACA|nr:hypothetical protein AG1IA_05044 [Rhizoctonia solani AG-1 IA]